jgi:MFS superfamily sulfate permease-like transporter
MQTKQLVRNLIPGLQVYFVALPLCLGIALGSGAPPLSGLIAGAVGGLIVGLLSPSPLSVSGPAAGLTSLVAALLLQLGDYTLFLTAVVLAGGMQLVFSRLKAGLLGEYIPNSVIKGMMAAIGLILILKQIPHLLGYDRDFEGDEVFFQLDGENTFSEIYVAFGRITPSSAFIGLLTLGLLIAAQHKRIKKISLFAFVPVSLWVILMGIGLGYYFDIHHVWGMNPNHMVKIPTFSWESLGSFFPGFPSFTGIFSISVWSGALMLAVVASLETLLGIEAVDKMDPFKRNSDGNKELQAQGIGNIFSGMLGGLPITSVVVRSSANVSAGATSKWSTVIHGLMIVISVLLFTPLLNEIPLSVLAALLLTVGYKLTPPALYVSMWRQGKVQFIPFLVTTVAILSSDLLKGIGVGILVGLYFVLKRDFNEGISLFNNGNNYLLKFKSEVHFLQKPLLKKQLRKIPHGAHVLIDFSKNEKMDEDIREILQEFVDQHKHNRHSIEIKSNPSVTPSPIILA